MTVSEAKYAVMSGAEVIYPVCGTDCEWRVVAIVSHILRECDRKGWTNSLRLVSPNCDRSVTEALMRDCRLKYPLPDAYTELTGA